MAADEEETKKSCLEVLKRLQEHEYGYIFANPVDPVKLGLPDYFDVIKKPMDFGTIQKNIDGSSYHSFDAFKLDVHLTLDNAMEYNMETTPVHEMAKELKKVFEADIKRLPSVPDVGAGGKLHLHAYILYLINVAKDVYCANTFLSIQHPNPNQPLQRRQRLMPLQMRKRRRLREVTSSIFLIAYASSILVGGSLRWERENT